MASPDKLAPSRGLSSLDCDAADIATKWTLETLVQQLRFFEKQFRTASVSEHINEKLHVTQENQLPDQEMGKLAAEAVHLLHDIRGRLRPSHLVLADHYFGYMDCKCLVAVCQLGVPDALQQGALTLEQLATTVHAREDRLGQVMRALRNNGIFSYDPRSGLYSNNSRSVLLTTNHWTQWHNWVDLYGNEFYDIARGIPASLRAGTPRSAAQHNFDTDEDMFTYFEKQGWVPRLHRTLGGGAIAQAPGILADYPWHEIADQTVVDLGGGGGSLIALLLRGNPTMRGGIFDLQQVVDHARPFFQLGGKYEDVGARVSPQDLVYGSFLEEVPSYHVYTIKWCLHDWRDEDAKKILQNIRRAINIGHKSRLIVLESVMSEGENGRLARYGDINMMMTAKGQERQESEWRKLADSSGWEIHRIFPPRNAWVSAIDMRPK